MAQKRMFSLQVVDTDRFMDMPTSTQALYFHLGMHGDDDGFVSSPKKISRAAGCSDDDLKLLAAKGFVIPFESGVLVITDWKINNTLKNDRYTETIYTQEKATLVHGKNGKYMLGTNTEPDCIQVGSTVEPQHNITEPNRTEPIITEDKQSAKPPVLSRKNYGAFGWVKLTDDQYFRLVSDLGETEAERCISYVDESAQTTGNKNRWKDWNLVVRKCSREGWGTRAGKVQSSNTGTLGQLARLYAAEELTE